MRDADGFLSRESWEQDLRAHRAQAAVELALEDGRLISRPCLEEVEAAFRRSHRGSKRTAEAWDVFRNENFIKPTKEFAKARTEIMQKACSLPITEMDWQREIKHRDWVRQHLKEMDKWRAQSNEKGD